MSNEKKARNSFGFWGDFGVGCALDVILMLGFAIIVMDAERIGHALGYALVLSIFVWGARWLLNQFDLLDGWCGRLIGPVVLVGAMLLAVFCPIKTDKADPVQNGEPSAAATNGTSSIVEQALPGVRLTPASTLTSFVDAGM